MILYYKKNHPNGFKILLAAKIWGVPLEIEEMKDIRNGAQLEFLQDEISIRLDANSAVLKIFGISNGCESRQLIEPTILEWLEWELMLQKYLFTYCEGLVGRDDKAIMENLNSQLAYLNLHVTSNFILGGLLSPVDIVLYGSLITMTTNSKCASALSSLRNVNDYIKWLSLRSDFKEVEKLYYGEKGMPVSCNHDSTVNHLRREENSRVTLGVNPCIDNSPMEERALTEKEVEMAKIAWKETIQVMSRGTPIASCILPVEGENNIMITSALPYVNNVPHLGNIIGCVLSADCFARFCRLRGDNVLYICGTDEYGTATETKALAENLTPKQICDKYNAIHCNVYDWFNIAFDYFGRTTTQSQTVAAQSIFWDLYNNGKVVEDTTQQLYCERCQRFLADRFAEGICPHPGCGYEDARGDQCDKCGKLVNATELINPRCKICSSTPTLRKSKHLFIDLPSIEADFKVWLETSSQQWTANAKVICESWLRDGLKERCITRDLQWGTPVPLDGFKDKVFYVWFDAPIGYISITMEYTKEWEKWWKNEALVSYYEFMAKDNVPFHGVIFPSCQIATKRPWTKVTHLMATEYLNYEDGKFSKGRGIGVFGDQAKDTGICSDVWRFYLLYMRPEAHDTTFSWSDLQMKNNTELLNNLGNFVNRSLKFVYQFFGGQIPPSEPTEADFKVVALVNLELRKYCESLSACKIRDGIRRILAISKIGNQYIQEEEPYKLVKPNRSEEDRRRGGTVINVSANIVALISVLLQPYMPDTSKTILTVLNNPEVLSSLPSMLQQFLPAGHRINEPFPLIRKITDEEVQVLRNKFAGSPSEKPIKQSPAENHQVNFPDEGDEVKK